MAKLVQQNARPITHREMQSITDRKNRVFRKNKTNKKQQITS